MNFIKTTICIFFALTTIVSTHAQNSNRDATIKEIDGFASKYDYKTFPEAFKNHHYRLKKAELINYPHGMLIATMHLMWCHGMDSKLDSVLYYAHKFESIENLHHDKELKFNYLFDKANLFNNNLGLTEQGLNTYVEAYNLTDKNDRNKKIRIQAFIAKCYIDKKREDKAISILSPYMKDANSLETPTKFDLFTILSVAYQRKKMYKESFPINTTVLALARKNKLFWEEANALNYLSYDYYLMGNYRKAIDSCLSIRKRLPNMAPEQMPTNSEFLSIYYNAIGDTKNAINYLTQAINTTLTHDELPNFYNELAGYYQASNQSKMAIESYKKRDAIIDSIRSREQRAFTDYYDTKIKFINQTQDKERIELQNSKQKSYIISLIIGLACLLLSILIFVVYGKYHKSEQKVEYLEQNEKEILKKHIEVRENELSALLISQAQKIDKLSEIEKIYQEATLSNNAEQLTLANKSLHGFINDTESFDVFAERLESQYPGIIHQLQTKHPELSSTDIKHSLLIKLGLSLKESAHLLNVSIATVKKARNRLIKKLDLPEDTNFKIYLDAIADV
jgi:DNA-binding CsgD family transcriptional regulator/tetratricopeptide (TPR) repeat protein